MSCQIQANQPRRPPSPPAKGYRFLVSGHFCVVRAFVFSLRARSRLAGIDAPISRFRPGRLLCESANERVQVNVRALWGPFNLTHVRFILELQLSLKKLSTKLNPLKSYFKELTHKAAQRFYTNRLLFNVRRLCVVDAAAAAVD